MQTAAYYYDVDISLYKVFDKNCAAYYFYYMYHYDDETSVNAVTAKNGEETMVQK